MSQNSCEHLHNLIQAHSPPLDQARRHTHIFHHPPIPLGFLNIRLLLPIRVLSSLPAFAVLGPLLTLALLGAVIGDAAPRGTLPAVCISAAEGATQVPTIGVAWMGEEENSAMPAALQVPPQVGTGPQDRPQDDIVLPNEVADLALVVPVRPELKTLLDLYAKNRGSRL